MIKLLWRVRYWSKRPGGYMSEGTPAYSEEEGQRLGKTQLIHLFSLCVLSSFSVLSINLGAENTC